MKYSGPSIVTSRQVGSTGVVIENDKIYNVEISQTKSSKSGIDEVLVFYMTKEFPGRWFPSGEVFDNSTAAKSAMEIV